jgi:hypothetical protein
VGSRTKSRISREWDWVHPAHTTTQNGPANTVAQASGMVSVQANCSVNHALVLMVMRAQETGATLEQIALAVVDGETSFRA